MALELKFTMFYLCSFFVCCCRVYVSVAEQEGHSHCLLLRWLTYFAYIDRQLSQGSHMPFVNEFHVWKLSFIENYSHDCLSCSDWAINFSMNFINTDGISFPDEGIKDILTKFFTLNHYLFAYWVNLVIENCKSVDSIGLFSYSWCDWSWVKTI